MLNMKKILSFLKFGKSKFNENEFTINGVVGGNGKINKVKVKTIIPFKYTQMRVDEIRLLINRYYD